MTTIDATTNGPAAPQPPGQPFPAPPPASRPRNGGRAVAIAFGVVLAVSGFLTAVSGAALLAIFGGGNAVVSGNHAVSTPTSAIVADLGHIDNIRGFEPLTGSPTLQISAQDHGGSGVFVGVGPTADVERYLNGVTIDRVTDLDIAPFRLDSVRDAGSASAGAPVEQSFWVASARSGTGTAAEVELSWAIDNGDYEIVVMNADGTSAVSADVSIGAGLPTSTGLWILVIGIGVLVLAGGTALIVVGARTGRRH